MNIIVTNKCPYKSAKFLDDKRLNKFILESAQMLNTAVSFYSNIKTPYKPTHKNNSVVKWVAKSRKNYEWLLRHFIALNKERKLRFPDKKVHKSSLDIWKYFELRKHIPENKQTQFVNRASRLELGIDYRNIKNVHKAYKLYIKERWKNDKIPPKKSGKIINLKNL